MKFHPLRCPDLLIALMGILPIEIAGELTYKARLQIMVLVTDNRDDLAVIAGTEDLVGATKSAGVIDRSTTSTSRPRSKLMTR